jgi:hypothetical protein
MQHDEFSQLRQQISDVSLQQLATGQVELPDIMAAAARTTYQFISHHRLDFPRLIAKSKKTVTSQHAADEFGRQLSLRAA